MFPCGSHSGLAGVHTLGFLALLAASQSSRDFKRWARPMRPSSKRLAGRSMAQLDFDANGNKKSLPFALVGEKHGMP